jgi:hypothetical protein
MKPDIIADISFLSLEEGGARKIPIVVTKDIPYLSCPLEFKGKYFDCRLLLDDIGTIQLGSHAKNVPIRFLTRLLEGKLFVGSTFTLWSSGIFANGVVTKINWSESDNDLRARTLEELDKLSKKVKQNLKKRG